MKTIYSRLNQIKTSDKLVFLCVPSFALFSILLGQIRFRTNDDVAMFYLSNGNLYGFPSNNLIFTGRIIGFLVSFLEFISPGVNWYPTLMIISVVIALLVIIKILLDESRNEIHSYAIKISLFILVLYGLGFIRVMQFTQTSILCTTAGILITFRQKHSKKNICASATLILLGVSWRPESGVLTLMILFLITLIQLILNHGNKSKFLTLLFWPTLFVSISYLINLILYNSFAPWIPYELKEFVEYTGQRGRLHASYYLGSPNSFKDAANLGISKNDLELFRYFYTANNSVFSVDNLSILVKKSILFENIFDSKNIFYFFKRPIYYHIFDIVLLLLVTSNFKFKTFIYNRKVWISWIASFGILYIIYLFLNMPTQLFLPIIYVCAVTIWLLSKSDSIFPVKDEVVPETANPRLRHLRKLFHNQNIVGFIFAVMCLTSFLFSNFSNASSPEAQTMRRYVSAKPIIAFPSFYSSITSINPFSDIQKNIPNSPNLISFGSMTRSPESLIRLAQLSLNKDLLENVLLGRAYLGVTTKNEESLVSEYIQEHYEKKVKFIRIFPVGLISSDNLRVLGVINVQ